MLFFLQSGDLLSGDSLCDKDKECDILIWKFYDNDCLNSNDDTISKMKIFKQALLILFVGFFSSSVFILISFFFTFLHSPNRNYKTNFSCNHSHPFLTSMQSLTKRLSKLVFYSVTTHYTAGGGESKSSSFLEISSPSQITNRFCIFS